jgi:hypothetical protein
VVCGPRLHGGRGGPPDPKAQLLHLLHSTASGDLAFYIQPPSTFVFTPFVEKQNCHCPRLLVVLSASALGSSEPPACLGSDHAGGRSWRDEESVVPAGERAFRFREPGDRS